MVSLTHSATVCLFLKFADSNSDKMVFLYLQTLTHFGITIKTFNKLFITNYVSSLWVVISVGDAVDSVVNDVYVRLLQELHTEMSKT